MTSSYNFFYTICNKKNVFIYYYFCSLTAYLTDKILSLQNPLQTLNFVRLLTNDHIALPIVLLFSFISHIHESFSTT